jgi:hypothetical protein
VVCGGSVFYRDAKAKATGSYLRRLPEQITHVVWAIIAPEQPFTGFLKYPQATRLPAILMLEAISP